MCVVIMVAEPPPYSPSGCYGNFLHGTSLWPSWHLFWL